MSRHWIVQLEAILESPGSEPRCPRGSPRRWRVRPLRPPDRAILRWLLILACSACTDETLQRMMEQPKYRTYAQNVFFDDERALRSPPLGTVPRERRPLDPASTGGRIDGAYVDRIPIPLTFALMQRGRKQFNIFCAACHGLVGDGDSVVAEKMSLRPPPSLHDFRQKPVGFFYEVITQGYGLMPSYATALSSADCWAVVAYVQALQRSQSARLDQAPAEIRAQLLKELP